MKEAFSISVAKLEKPTALSFDAQPAAVKAWVHGLPMGHIGEATRQIFSALRETNSLEINGGDRFELLEAVWRPVGMIVPALQRHYATQQFPIPDKGVKIADLSTNLQAEMITGYRLALAATTGGGLFARKAQKRVKVTCLQRMLQLLRGVLFNYLVLNLPYPVGFWRELHRVYADANKSGWLGESVIEPISGHKSTLEQEYRHALLLALLDTHLLRPDQGRAVIESMGYWADQAGLIENTADNKPEVAFCVAANMDVPPLGDDQRCEQLRQAGAHCLWLDTTRLRNHISELRGRAQGGSVTLPDGQRLTVDSLGVLLGSWGEAPNRMEERRAVDYQAEVAIGLTALHRVMALSASAPAEPATTAEEEAFEEAVIHASDLQLTTEIAIDKGDVHLREGELSASTEDNDSRWGYVFNQGQKAQSWTDNIRHREYTPVQGQVVDRSEHGYRVSLPIDGIEQIRVGDLVGLRDGASGQWRAGSVRWLRQVDSALIQVGLQVHLDQATPVGVVVQAKGGESAPLDSVLGLSDGKPVLAIPCLPGIENKSLAINDGEVKTRIDLTGRVAGSATFEAHGFEVRRADFVENGAEGNGLLRQISEQHLPKKRVREEPPSPAMDDEYGSLWSGL